MQKSRVKETRKIEKGERKSEIVENLFLRNSSFSRSDIHLSNIYIGDFECDILRISNSNYLYEYEIKISPSDFMADYKKHKRKRIGGKLTTTLKHDIIISGERTNYFSFVVSENLAHLVSEIDDRYGFFVVDTTTNKMSCVKRPKLLHKRKFSSWKKLCRKMFWRNK